jgi:hypothetical protein
MPEGEKTWRYLPLNQKNKPLFAWRSNADLAQFRNGIEYGKWITEASDAGYGVGVLPGESNLVIIDCDSGLELGRRTRTVYGLGKFLDWCEQQNQKIEPTFTTQSKTPGHYHFYYEQHPEYRLSHSRIHTEIPYTDIKVSGFVVAWMSPGYTVARDLPVVRLPEWMAKALGGGRSSNGSNGAVAAPGSRDMTDDYAQYLLNNVQYSQQCRNNTLFAAASDFRSAGRVSPHDRQALLQCAVYAGLTDHAASATISSAWSEN